MHHKKDEELRLAYQELPHDLLVDITKTWLRNKILSVMAKARHDHGHPRHIDPIRLMAQVDAVRTHILTRALSAEERLEFDSLVTLAIYQINTTGRRH